MRDETRRTPAQLEAELAMLRQRVAALEGAEQVAHEARRYAEQVVDTVHEALLMLDGTLWITTANRAFLSAVQRYAGGDGTPLPLRSRQPAVEHPSTPAPPGGTPPNACQL